MATWRRVKKIPMFLEAAIVTAMSRLALTLLPFRSLQTLLPRTPSEQQRGDALSLTAAVARVSPLIPRATCLTQAVAGHVLLARHGYASEIHIGVKKGDTAKFHAHAWLARGENVVLGHADHESFVPLASFGN